MPLTREQTKYIPTNDTVFLPTVAIDNNLGVRGTSLFNGTATFNNVNIVGGSAVFNSGLTSLTSFSTESLAVSGLASIRGLTTLGTVGSALAQVTITPLAASTSGLIIRGFPSQTASFFDIQTSAGTSQFLVDNNGTTTIKLISSAISSGGNSPSTSAGKYLPSAYLGGSTWQPLVVKTFNASPLYEALTIINSTNNPLFAINGLGEIISQNNNRVPLAVRATPNTSVPIESISGDGSTVTYTTTGLMSNYYVVGSTVTITGATTAGFNGTFTVTSVNDSGFAVTNTTTGTSSAATATIAAQVADLTQWRNQSGTAISKIDASGNIIAPALIPSSSTVPTNGIYLSAVNTLNLATNTTNRMSIDSAGLVTIPGALTVSGDLTVNGTTTNINTTNLVVEDKNIILGDVTTPSNTTADGGGITLKGLTDKTFNWVNATSSWTSSEDLNLLTGKVLRIAGTQVLSATQILGITPTVNATGFSLSGGTTAVAVTFAGGAAYTLSGTNAQTYTFPSTGGTLPLNNQQFFIGTQAIAINQGTGTIASLPGVTSVNGTTIPNAATLLTSTTGVTTFSGGTTGLTPAAGTSGAITLAGTLAVANGGTGVTSSTGSTSVVLSSSPTITTPVIDTINASATTATTSLHPTVTTGSIAIGAGLTTGALNIATVGTGATPISIGHTNATLAITTSGTTLTTAGALTLASTIQATTATLTGATLAINGASPTISSTNASAASIFTSNVTGITIGSSTIKTTAFPAEGTTSTAAAGEGYMGMPQVSTASTRGFIASDAGKHIYVTATGQTLTIPANTGVAFPIGTTIVVVNGSGVSTSIAITTDTLRLANTASTGTRTLASNGMCTLLKINTTEWIASGNGLT